MKARGILSASIALGAISLAGCGVPAVEPSGHHAPPIAALGASNTLYKLCDGGRAVYVVDGFKSTAISVVANAPECVRPAQPIKLN